jgi:hypothetical protein
MIWHYDWILAATGWRLENKNGLNKLPFQWIYHSSPLPELVVDVMATHDPRSCRHQYTYGTATALHSVSKSVLFIMSQRSLLPTFATVYYLFSYICTLGYIFFKYEA